MPHLLNALYLLALVLLSPWLFYKALTTHKYRRGLADKFLGRAFVRRSTAPCAWFHGVSVGEIHLLRTLIAEFRRRHPDWDCVVSTTTDTAYDEARKCFADLPVFFWPFDFSAAVHRAFRRVNPTLVVLAESELWPNFLLAAQARGVPVAVVNGRMSPRSFSRWKLVFHPASAGWRGLLLAPLALVVAPMLRRVLRCVSLWAVQTHEYSLYYGLLGIAPERVVVTGSIKYDGVRGDRDNSKTRDLAELLAVEATDLVWICGSTQDPEEAIAVEIYRKLREHHLNLRLMLVPRQKDRFDEVARLLERSGLSFVRRSALERQSTSESAAQARPETFLASAADSEHVVLVDTIGELSALWGLADVAFVGGSLDGRRGGQNMIEPAAYGAAVLFGPHVWNFRDTAERLVAAGGAVQVSDAEALENAVSQLLADAEERRHLGSAARHFVSQQNGATARTVDRLEDLMHLDRAALAA